MVLVRMHNFSYNIIKSCANCINADSQPNPDKTKCKECLNAGLGNEDNWVFRDLVWIEDNNDEKVIVKQTKPKKKRNGLDSFTK